MGFANGAFEDSKKESEAVVEEFFNAATAKPEFSTATLPEKQLAKADAGAATSEVTS